MSDHTSHNPAGEERTADELADAIADRGLTEAREERSVLDVREWVAERRDHEYRNRPAPEHGNTVASGMAMGAIETLDALTAYLNGDDDA